MSTNEKKVIILHEKDNVATATCAIAENEYLQISQGIVNGTVDVIEAIPLGHKIALVDIPRDGEIIKYGEVIGVAAYDLKAGCLVHVHNVESLRGRGDLAEKEAVQ